MKRNRIQILTVNCPRCGKAVATLNRSITGAEDLKSKYGGICQTCITPQENQEIIEGQAASILKMSYESEMSR